MPHFDPGLQLELIETYRGTFIPAVCRRCDPLLAHTDAWART